MSQHDSALVVIDMQNDYLAEGGYYAVKDERNRQGGVDGDNLAYLAELHKTAPPAYATREDYQGLVERVEQVAAAALAGGLTTVFVRAAYERSSQHRPPLFLQDPDRRDHGCHPGTWGADFVEPLKPLIAHRHAVVVNKPTFDGFYQTDLHKLLSARGATTIYLSGVETNVCVLFTACSALSRGFDTIVLEDCVATSQPHLHEPALQIIEMAKGRRMRQRDYMSMIDAAKDVV